MNINKEQKGNLKVKLIMSIMLFMLSVSIVMAESISSDQLTLKDGGPVPLNPGDSSECIAKWDCSDVVWEEECNDGLQNIIVPPGDVWPDDVCSWTGTEEEREACYFLEPSNMRGCFQSESFPFFTGWNVIGVIILLAGFYAVRLKKK